MAQQRRRSLDDPIDFKNFGPEFYKQEPRMRQIIGELQQICDQTRERKEEVPLKAGLAGLAVGGGAVLGLIFAPFTAGVSLAVAGAAAAGGAAGVLVCDKITDRNTLDKVKELVEEFCGIAQPLIDVQNKRKQMLDELSKNPEEVSIITVLLGNLRSLFLIFTKDSTVERLLEVTAECRKILEHLKDFSLQEY